MGRVLGCCLIVEVINVNTGEFVMKSARVWSLVLLLLIASCARTSELGASESVHASVSSSADTPNVILILADDLGPGLIGAYGQKIIETPHIDQLIREGMSFNNYYTPVLCAPARWSLLTGMHDGRVGGWAHTTSGIDKAMSNGRLSQAEYDAQLAKIQSESTVIPDHEVFTAQIAQSAGYITAQFGKLDQGFTTWNERVRRFGWDYHFGYYDHSCAHGFYPPYLWKNGEKVFFEGNDSPDCGKFGGDDQMAVGSEGAVYSQNVLIEDLLRFIDENADRKFFVYHPTQLPHGPVAIPELHPDYAENPNLTLSEKKYASMVRMLDSHVGLIMAKLKERGLDDNTIVFFSSDNGHELYYGPKRLFKQQIDTNGNPTDLDGYKWRTSEQGDVFDGAGGRAGKKRTPYQGGTQGVMVARWPGQIPAGVSTEWLAAHYDFMATLGEIVGVDTPKGKDSRSFLPALVSGSIGSTRPYVVVNNRFDQMGRTALITKDGLKLIEIDRETDDYQLYDLTIDNEERNDLSASNPETVEALKKILLAELDSDRPDL